VDYYRDIADLNKKIRYYHEHDAERIQIARAGWKRSQEDFSAQRISRFMIDATFRTGNYTDIPWPKYILDEGKKVCWEDPLPTSSTETSGR